MTTESIVEIPKTAFGVTLSQLAAWDKSPANPLLYSVEVFRGPCDYGHLSGPPYDGYLLPANNESSAWIGGWLQGRRSAGLSEWPA